MNTRTLLLMGAVGYAVSATTCPAQTMVSTDPVGVVTTDLPASGFTYLAVNLTTPPLLVSSNTTLSSGTIVNVGIDLDSLQAGTAYTMEIKSELMVGDESLEGYSVGIASWADQALTLTESLSAAGVTPEIFEGTRVVIRALPTVASIFGANNSAGLKGGTSSSADLIYYYSAGSFERYYYFESPFGGLKEWRDFGGNPAGSTVIHFGDGIIIETNDENPKQITISGTVKVGPTNIPLYPGFNLVSNPSPVEGSLTLGNSGLKDGLKEGTSSSADILYLPSGSGGFDKYFYFASPFGTGTKEWRNFDTGDNADNVPLPDGGSFYIERLDGDSSVTITEDLPNN